MEEWVSEVPTTTGWYFFREKATIKKEYKWIPIYVLSQKKGSLYFIGDGKEVKCPKKGFWKAIDTVGYS